MKKVKEGYKMTDLGEIPHDWDIKKIDEVFIRITKKNTEENMNVLTISAKDGLINQEKFFNKIVASKDNRNYYVLEKGDFGYNKSYSNGYPMGAIRRLERYDKGIVSPLYICFRLRDTNSSENFYKYYFEDTLIEKEIASIAQEGARNHGLLNVGVNDFFQLNIIIPPLPEQKKIASILSKVDEQIELTDNLIEKTKDLKKGLMQNLLTKGIGHTEFKETEIGKIPMGWEVKSLKSIAEICYGKNQKSIEEINGKYNILGTGGVIGKTNNFLWDKPSVLIGRKGTINKPQYIEVPFWTVDTLFYTKLKNGFIAKWLYYYLNLIDLKKYNEATGVPSLNTTSLNSIKIPSPPLPEQKKIASILSSVDTKIEEYQNKKSKLEELKKGLMQQLLTGKIRVKVDSDIYALVNQEVCENI